MNLFNYHDQITDILRWQLLQADRNGTSIDEPLKRPKQPGQVNHQPNIAVKSFKYHQSEERITGKSRTWNKNQVPVGESVGKEAICVSSK